MSEPTGKPDRKTPHPIRARFLEALFWVLALSAAVLAALASGPGAVDWAQAAEDLGHLAAPPEVWSASGLIVFQLRLPRVLLGLIVGAGLAVCGALVQAVVRNPLASPEILGVSAGAGGGALAAITLFPAAGTVLGVPVGACLGAALAAAAVFLLSGRSGVRSETLILAGMAVSSLLAALTALLLTFSKQTQLNQYLFWILGSLENRRWEHLAFAAPLLLPLLALVLALRGRLNYFALGPDGARTVGFSWKIHHGAFLTAAVFGTAVCVSVSGAIGFLGLLVPHALRLVFGDDLRVLLPRIALAGALLLCAADSLAKNLFSPLELPVGIFTALAGVPFFLYLLRRGPGSARTGGHG